MSAFESEPADIDIHDSGWFDLPSGGSITKLPLWDKRNEVFARIGAGAGRMWLSKMGALLPGKAQLDEMHEHSLFIDPYTLPTNAMTIAAGIPKPWMDENGRDTPAMAAYRAANMSTLAWAKFHDAEVFARLYAARWTGEEPVSNAGKHWFDRGLYGWWRRNGRVIQAPYSKHGDNHRDYGSTVHGYSPGGPVFKWADGLMLDCLPVGIRAVAWMGYQSTQGVKEIAGIKHNETILSYSRHCRRKGTFKGVDKWGNGLWSGGFALPLSRDEDPWCAAFASESLRCALLRGECPPHGLRVSVRELVEDARVAKTLIDKTIPPKIGWLAILGRLGESPMLGGRGHVRCVIDAPSAKEYRAIGGNESNAIGMGNHLLSDVHGWIIR